MAICNIIRPMRAKDDMSAIRSTTVVDEIIDAKDRVRPLGCEPNSSFDLVLPYHRSRHEQTVNAVIGKHLRLTDLRSTNSGSAGFDLSPGDLGTFVSLAVRAECLASLFGMARHLGNVCLEGIEFKE